LLELATDYVTIVWLNQDYYELEAVAGESPTLYMPTIRKAIPI
jgi:hypothetical protein